MVEMGFVWNWGIQPRYMGHVDGEYENPHRWILTFFSGAEKGHKSQRGGGGRTFGQGRLWDGTMDVPGTSRSVQGSRNEDLRQNCIKIARGHMYHPVIKKNGQTGNPPFDIFQWTFRWAHHLQCGIFQKTPVDWWVPEVYPLSGISQLEELKGFGTTNTWPLRRNTRKPCRWGPGPGLIGLSWMPQHIKKCSEKGAAPKVSCVGF